MRWPATRSNTTSAPPKHLFAHIQTFGTFASQRRETIFANRMGTRCCRAGEVIAANKPMNFNRNGLNAQKSRALGGSQSLPALSLVCKFRCSVLFAAVRTSRHTVGAQGLNRGSGSCWFSIESSRAQKQCPFLDALLPCFLTTFLQACLCSIACLLAIRHWPHVAAPSGSAHMKQHRSSCRSVLASPCPPSASPPESPTPSKRAPLKVVSRTQIEHVPHWQRPRPLHWAKPTLCTPPRRGCALPVIPLRQPRQAHLSRDEGLE